MDPDHKIYRSDDPGFCPSSTMLQATTSYVLLFAALQPRKTYSQLIVTFHAENDYTSASSISVLSFCYLCPLC